jgi:hypothetical protein
VLPQLAVVAVAQETKTALMELALPAEVVAGVRILTLLGQTQVVQVLLDKVVLGVLVALMAQPMTLVAAAAVRVLTGLIAPVLPLVMAGQAFLIQHPVLL